jgi:hypothetical protein
MVQPLPAFSIGPLEKKFSAIRTNFESQPLGPPKHSASDELFREQWRTFSKTDLGMTVSSLFLGSE